jgi:formylglycine-generating enzyme required for sulfatase activity
MRIVAPGDIVVELLPIPSGEFLMASANDLFSEAPFHTVSFRSGFLLGKYPITQAQWRAVMGDTPSVFLASPDRPVESISWDQATEFCRRLADQPGKRVRLPSEAEWEYACRAGTIQ